MPKPKREVNRDATIKDVVESAKRAGGFTGKALEQKLKATLFRQQLALIDDTAHPMRVACCSRRAGKTQGIVRGMILKCLQRPKAEAAYFATTLSSARKIVWDSPEGFPSIVHDLGLNAVCELNETEHRIRFANGSVLWASGAETVADARRWRGLRFDIVVCDESQDWDDEVLRYMVDQVIAPSLMDRAGEAILTGTPGPVLGGLFYEACTGASPGWGIHGWTCLDNPHLPNAAQYIIDQTARRGLSPDDPIVLREFRGQWVRDLNSLLFQYDQFRNDYVALPDGPSAFNYVLGCDVGVRDLASFVVTAYRDHDPTVYICEVYGERAKETTAPVSRFAEIIRGYQSKYGMGMRLVMDQGALGLGYAMELINRYGLVIEPAKKTEKAAAIRLMNDQLRLGMIKVGPGSAELLKEWKQLQIDPKTQIEKKGAQCDYSDAALYAWRKCYAYLAQPEPPTGPEADRAAMISRVLSAKLNEQQTDLESQDRKNMLQGQSWNAYESSYMSDL